MMHTSYAYSVLLAFLFLRDATSRPLLLPPLSLPHIAIHDTLSPTAYAVPSQQFNKNSHTLDT